MGLLTRGESRDGLLITQPSWFYPGKAGFPGIKRGRGAGQAFLPPVTAQCGALWPLRPGAFPRVFKSRVFSPLENINTTTPRLSALLKISQCCPTPPRLSNPPLSPQKSQNYHYFIFYFAVPPHSVSLRPCLRRT